MKTAVRAVSMLAIVAIPVVIWAQTGAGTPVPPAPATPAPVQATTPAPAVAAPVPAPAPARSPAAPNEPLPMDFDGDGTVTAMEHAAGARALFEHMDANHDERVTREEMLVFQRQVLGALPPNP